MFDNILLETDDPIAVLTMNRPEKRNAINNNSGPIPDQNRIGINRQTSPAVAPSHAATDRR